MESFQDGLHASFCLGCFLQNLERDHLLAFCLDDDLIQLPLKIVHLGLGQSAGYPVCWLAPACLAAVSAWKCRGPATPQWWTATSPRRTSTGPRHALLSFSRIRHCSTGVSVGYGYLLAPNKEPCKNAAPCKHSCCNATERDGSGALQALSREVKQVTQVELRSFYKVAPCTTQTRCCKHCTTR